MLDVLITVNSNFFTQKVALIRGVIGAKGAATKPSSRRVDKVKLDDHRQYSLNQFQRIFGLDENKNKDMNNWADPINVSRTGQTPPNRGQTAAQLLTQGRITVTNARTIRQ